jgi:hypothetical protein
MVKNAARLAPESNVKAVVTPLHLPYSDYRMWPDGRLDIVLEFKELKYFFLSGP